MRLLLVALVAFGGCLCSSPHPPREAGAGAVRELRVAADRMCRCRDTACRAEVYDQFDRRLNGRVVISQTVADDFDRELQRFLGCRF